MAICDCAGNSLSRCASLPGGTIHDIDGKLVATVMQEPTLFSRSIGENAQQILAKHSATFLDRERHNH